MDERPEERAFFAEDALRGRAATIDPAFPPFAVVRPADAESVARVLALASDHGIAVTPYGAGTGLMGGARSVQPGIVLDTVRLNSIEIRAADRVVWAGAGTVLKDVDAALREHNLCLGHDPWTFPVATVGGTLSTNSLGYRGGRYGGMGDQAIALEVALADGSLIRTRAVRRNSAGPNYARLFIAAEGTLGVITAAALTAFAVPERQELHGYYFERFEDGFAAIDAMAALGMRPSLLDYGEEHASPWPDLAPREEERPILYLGFEGWAEEVEASISRVERIVGENNGTPAEPDAAQRFWDTRHVIGERFARTRRQRDAGNNRPPGVAFDYMHVALPPSQVLTYRQYLHEESARTGIGLMECGIWTGPECFSAVLALPDHLGGAARLREVMDGLLTEVQRLGGSMEYVHGAGLRLAHLMEQEHGAAGMDVLRRMKKALDPAGIINPGKQGL